MFFIRNFFVALLLASPAIADTGLVTEPHNIKFFETDDEYTQIRSENARLSKVDGFGLLNVKIVRTHEPVAESPNFYYVDIEINFVHVGNNCLSYDGYVQYDRSNGYNLEHKYEFYKRHFTTGFCSGGFGLVKAKAAIDLITMHKKNGTILIFQGYKFKLNTNGMLEPIQKM